MIPIARSRSGSAFEFLQLRVIKSPRPLLDFHQLPMKRTIFLPGSLAATGQARRNVRAAQILTDLIYLAWSRVTSTCGYASDKDIES